MSATFDENFVLRPEDLTLTDWSGVHNPTQDRTTEEVENEDEPSTNN